MKIKNNFLFIVFNEPDVVGVIQYLSSILGGKIQGNPHLTIQGPFDEKVQLQKIESIKDKLKDDLFFIGNPGIFSTRNGVALYLKIQSPNLLSVWDKPDFPVAKYGFNPHITIYEGPDRARAERALAFLKKNHVELLSRDFEVVQYVSKQEDMFPVTGAIGDENAISKLMSKGKLSSSFRANFISAVSTPES